MARQSLQRHVEDSQFNELTRSGNPAMILLAVGMKYGFAPIACLVMLYYIHAKDSQIDKDRQLADLRQEANQKQLVDLVQKTTEALNNTANSEKELVMAIHRDIEERRK